MTQMELEMLDAALLLITSECPEEVFESEWMAQVYDYLMNISFHAHGIQPEYMPQTLERLAKNQTENVILVATLRARKSAQ